MRGEAKTLATAEAARTSDDKYTIVTIEICNVGCSFKWTAPCFYILLAAKHIEKGVEMNLNNHELPGLVAIPHANSRGIHCSRGVFNKHGSAYLVAVRKLHPANSRDFLFP